jgi:hypothetical protein
MEREAVNNFKVNEAHKNEWSNTSYQLLKKSKGMNSVRGSAFFKEIVHGLKGLKLPGVNGMDIEFQGGDHFASNWNTIYQRDYGKSFGLYLESKKVPFG